MRLKKVLMAYMASRVTAMKAAHPLGSPVILRGRLLWKPGVALVWRQVRVWPCCFCGFVTCAADAPGVAGIHVVLMHGSPVRQRGHVLWRPGL